MNYTDENPEPTRRGGGGGGGGGGADLGYETDASLITSKKSQASSSASNAHPPRVRVFYIPTNQNRVASTKVKEEVIALNENTNTATTNDENLNNSTSDRSSRVRASHRQKSSSRTEIIND